MWRKIPTCPACVDYFIVYSKYNNSAHWETSTHGRLSMKLAKSVQIGCTTLYIGHNNNNDTAVRQRCSLLVMLWWCVAFCWFSCRFIYLYLEHRECVCVKVWCLSAALWWWLLADVFRRICCWFAPQIYIWHSLPPNVVQSCCGNIYFI